jgi:hypothetical protein
VVAVIGAVEESTGEDCFSLTRTRGVLRIERGVEVDVVPVVQAGFCLATRWGVMDSTGSSCLNDSVELLPNFTCDEASSPCTSLIDWESLELINQQHNTDHR